MVNMMEQAKFVWGLDVRCKRKKSRVLTQKFRAQVTGKMFSSAEMGKGKVPSGLWGKIGSTFVGHTEFGMSFWNKITILSEYLDVLICTILEIILIC